MNDPKVIATIIAIFWVIIKEFIATIFIWINFLLDNFIFLIIINFIKKGCRKTEIKP